MATEQTSTTSAQATPETPAQNTTSTSTAQEGSPKREYTQAELDRIMSERATRAAQQATKKLLEQLGVASESDLPTLKDTITKAREREQADMTAAERAQKEVESAKKQTELLQQQLAAEKTARRTQMINAGIRDAVKTAPDADLVLMYLRQSHTDEVETLLAEGADKVDADKLKKLLDAAKKEKPILFSGAAGSPGSPSASGGRTLDPDAKVKEQGARDLKRSMRANF